MQENLQVLLTLLVEEKGRLEIEKDQWACQLVALSRLRATVVHNYLLQLLPDLKMSTIRALLRQVPGFQVPTIREWFGLCQRVDPSVSISDLRGMLGSYLEHTHGVTCEYWKNTIPAIDAPIRSLRGNQIRLFTERLADISLRIAAVEELREIDVAKMSPEWRAQLEQAVASQVEGARQPLRFYGGSYRNVELIPPYPSRAWFWGQLLTPNSGYAREVHRIKSGGGRELADVVVQEVTEPS